MTAITHISEWIEKILGFSYEMQRDIFKSILIILVLMLIRKGLIKLVTRFNKNVKSSYWLRNTITYALFLIGIIGVGHIWFQGFELVATYLGLLSAGIAIALKDPIVNIAGWVFILFRQPFEVGDRIQIGEHSGDVIDLRIFQFTLNEIGNWVDADQSTGRIIHIPNAKIFYDSIANYNKGFTYIWHEIPILLTFESDWKTARKILQKIVNEQTQDISEQARLKLRKAAEKYMIMYTKLTPIVYLTVKDSGILLTIRYLTHPRRRRGSSEQLWEAILTEFEKHDNIDYAYPTLRYYDNRTEGKKGARAD
ncbi:MAG: mechanosensitive ion channel family protein [Chitinophagales bacterium]